MNIIIPVYIYSRSYVNQTKAIVITLPLKCMWIFRHFKQFITVKMLTNKKYLLVYSVENYWFLKGYARGSSY